MKYKVDDCGLLIGLMKRPVGLFSEQDFYKQEIENNLCSRYSASLQSCMKGEKPVKYNMYTHIGYKTFGDHSLLSLILIDDFAYANRIFHPAHGCRMPENQLDSKKYVYDNYEHQIITCINTLAEKNPARLECFFEFLRDKKRERYPFICLIQAKLNSGLLMGNGIDFVELVKEAVRAIPTEKQSGVNTQDICLFVLDSLGSDELTVLCFAYNLSSLVRMAHFLRCMDMKYLIKIDKEKSLAIIEQSFIKKVLVTIKPEKLYESHIFSTVVSLPGYSIDLSEEHWDNFLFHPEEEQLKVGLGFTWHIKPGHPFLFHALLQKHMEEKIGVDSFQMSTSLWYYELSSLYDENSRLFSKDIFKKIEKLREVDTELKHTRKFQMKMFALSKSDDWRLVGNELVDQAEEAKNGHPSLKYYLKENYVFDLNFLLELRHLLGQCGVSEVLRERLIKIYNNFNDCISDPLFFNNFIDLRDSLALVKEKIADYLLEGEESLEEIHNWLGLYVQSFEQAYLNRFHQSNRMKNMSDFNIEWNGGIQQLLSPFDYIYKSLYNEVYKNDSIFLHVSGYDRIHVTPFALRINIFQLTYPELFVSVIWKEIFNFFWEYRYNKNHTKLNNEYFVGMKYMFSGHFTDEIKYFLINDSDFNHQSEVFHFLYEGLDINYLTSFIADSAAFYVGYNGNWDAFSYWYWEFLFQMTLHYGKDARLTPKIFVRFLSRMQFIMLLENKDKVEELKFKPVDPSVSAYWLNYYNDTFSFVSLLIKILEKFNFIISLKSSIFEFLGNEMIPIFQRLKKGSQKITEEEWKIPEALFENWRNDKGHILWLRQELFDKQTKDFRKLLDEHQIIQFSKEGTPELFIHCLFSSFLDKLKNLNIGSSEPELISKVNTSAEQVVPKDMIEVYSNILANRLGGMFCIDYAIRRESFAIRTLFYRSVFDFYNKKIAFYQVKK